MQLIVKNNDNKFFAYCISSFQEKDVPKAAGFRWNPKDRQWQTSDPVVANRLKEYADEESQQILDSFLQAREENIEASRAMTSDVEIPAPEGLEYMPFQKAGIVYATSRPSTLIGDEMGLGKTIQAIGVINVDADIKSVLVICPASLKINWKRELEKWLVRPLSVEIANGKELPGANIIIINYDIISKHKEALTSRQWDLMIVDESHYLKNPRAIRTKQVLGVKGIGGLTAKRRLFLTGTPILNRPIELWSILNALQVEGLGKSWFAYAQRYCAGYQTRWGWDVSGNSNLAELQEKLRATVMVRRLKKDVLTELPAKRRQIIELPANGLKGVIKDEKEAWEQQEKAVAELKIRVELAKASDDPEEYERAVENLRGGMSAAFTEIARLRHATALAKVPMVISFLQETLESIEKVVVFCHHKDVLEAIRSEFADSSVVLTGDCNMQARQDAVDRFQEDSKVRVFLGTIGAAGVGITLTASSNVIFVELDWVPGNMTQSEDRLHRINQKNSVLVQHLVLQDSLDAKLAQTLVAKQKVIDQALDIENGFINEPVIPLISEIATSSVSRKKVEEEAVNLTEEQRIAIHEALKILSALCDGARSLDGMGFNKFDAQIGKELAGRNNLSSKQAILGRKIVWKYKGQLPEEVVEKIKEG